MNKLRSLKNIIFKKTVLKRRAMFFISDILFISFSMAAAFWLRFNGVIPPSYGRALPYFIGLALAIKIIFLFYFNAYYFSWSFIGLNDMVRLFEALTLSSLTLSMFLYVLRMMQPFKIAPFPRSVLFMDYALTFILVGFFRFSKRIWFERTQSHLDPREKTVRVLIVGAGSAGVQIVREITRNKKTNYWPIGFIDDDPNKQGLKIYDLPVLGSRQAIPDVLATVAVDEVWIAIPSAHSGEIREIVNIIHLAKQTETIKILPSTLDLINGKVTLSDVQKIKLEDLLGRPSVKVEMNLISRFLNQKRILISGAGGSIGQELTKQIHQFKPVNLVLLDIDETELFHVVKKMALEASEIIPVIGDVRDRQKMERIFAAYKPQIVLHSAAYKHVPILEFFPEEAVKTNVLGTKVLAETALKYGTEKFIFISTDKAINPKSVMGATKRVSEEYLKTLNSKDGMTLISVRFGNVMGSRGSVIPLFEEQIRKGGPVTVTHPEMKRYFMSVSEAVLLILEASSFGEGGEVFILDMGQPIKIVDLAREMIRLSGYEPDSQIPIVYTCLRPGEKLTEELLGSEEGVAPTSYEKIFTAKSSKQKDPGELRTLIEQLITVGSENGSKDDIIRLLKEIVPTYDPESGLNLNRFW